MLTEPTVFERPEQHYAAIRASVKMDGGFGEVLDESWPEVFARLEALGVAPAGAPFLRYDVIDMSGELQIEVAVPVDAFVSPEGRVKPGVVPAGRYAGLTYVGHYDGLMDANAALQDWAEAQGLRWDVREAEDGEHWGSRLEIYETDPRDEPDPANWRTEVVYRLADD